MWKLRKIAIVMSCRIVLDEALATAEAHSGTESAEEVVGIAKIVAELDKLRDVPSLWKLLDETEPVAAVDGTAEETTEVPEASQEVAEEPSVDVQVNHHSASASSIHILGGEGECRRRSGHRPGRTSRRPARNSERGCKRRSCYRNRASKIR